MIPLAQPLPRAVRVRRQTPAALNVTLDYEGRFLRRKRLAGDGFAVMVDLPEAVSLNPGDALECEDGTLIGIRAAIEPCLRVTGASLPRLAWHIGNRHTPCQIGEDHLLIRSDPVLAGMLAHLGAEVMPIMIAFTPEGGAYGHGRTFGHEH